MDALSRDLRFAFRLIRKAPVLAIATIVTLAAGIGLNAGVFTVLSGLLLRPRVTVNPDTFVHLQPEYSGTNAPRHESAAFSTRDYLAIRDRTTTLRAVMAWSVRGTGIGAVAPFRELTMLVSCGFFDVYGLDGLEQGRTFLADECTDRPVPVAIISDELWTRHFDSDPDILRKSIVIDGRPFTIIGVAPASFSGRLRGDGVWIPYAWEPVLSRGGAFADPGAAWLWVEGRMKPGITNAQVASEMNVLMRQQDKLMPGRASAVAVNNGALIHEPAVRPVAMFVLPLVLSSVGLVLLIACGNVTLLLLSRAVARQREIAIRLAIGCSRGRLVRMLLTESVLLAMLGVPLSVWLAWQAPVLMRRLFPMMPYYPMNPDVTVFSYLAAASLAAGLIAGLAPAIESLKQRLTPMLAGQDAIARLGGRFGIRDVLIAAQIGMSLVLLAGTVIFLRAERAIALRDPSVDAAHVMMVPYDPHPGASAALMPALSARLRQLPGVHAIAYAAGGDSLPAPLLVVRGREISTQRTVPISVVSASFFDVMRRPMLQGRGFVEEQALSTVQPIVISDTLARVWWPDGSAIGAQLDSNDGRRYEVVGVTHADVAFTAGTADSIQAFVLAPSSPSPGDFFVRFEGDAVALQSLVRNVLRDLTPNAVGDPVTLAAADANTASKFMPLVEMVGSLGVIAIVLALVGVYGVVSFAVGRRTREIGVRMALGATRADIAHMVVSSAAPPIVAGIAVGLVLLIPAAVALARLFRDAPVPLHPTDPVTYAVVVITLGAVALITVLVPARQASAVPPSEALRTEQRVF
jgi:predicted permease